MLFCAVLCCAVLCCVVLCCAVLVVLCCVLLCDVVLCCVVLCCAVLCCVVLCCVVLCCVVLCCVVLCCVVLRRAVLCVPGWRIHDMMCVTSVAEHDTSKLEAFLSHVMCDEGSVDGVVAADLSQAKQLWRIRESCTSALSQLGTITGVHI